MLTARANQYIVIHCNSLNVDKARGYFRLGQFECNYLRDCNYTISLSYVLRIRRNTNRSKRKREIRAHGLFQIFLSFDAVMRVRKLTAQVSRLRLVVVRGRDLSLLCAPLYLEAFRKKGERNSTRERIRRARGVRLKPGRSNRGGGIYPRAGAGIGSRINPWGRAIWPSGGTKRGAPAD